MSHVITAKTKAQRDDLIDTLGEDNKDYNDEYHGAEASVENDTSVWIHSEEAVDMGALADIIAAWQTKHKITTPEIISCAFTCSKPRTDAYGGLAVLIYHGKQYWYDPTDLAQAKLDRLQASEKKGKKK